jgi:hypothetical protein
MHSLFSYCLMLSELLRMMGLLIVHSLLVIGLKFMHSLMSLLLEFILHRSDLIFLGQELASDDFFFLIARDNLVPLLPDFILKQLVLLSLLLQTLFYFEH